VARDASRNRITVRKQARHARGCPFVTRVCARCSSFDPRRTKPADFRLQISKRRLCVDMEKCRTTRCEQRTESRIQTSKVQLSRPNRHVRLQNAGEQAGKGPRETAGFRLQPRTGAVARSAVEQSTECRAAGRTLAGAQGLHYIEEKTRIHNERLQLFICILMHPIPMCARTCRNPTRL